MTELALDLVFKSLASMSNLKKVWLACRFRARVEPKNLELLLLSSTLESLVLEAKPRWSTEKNYRHFNVPSTVEALLKSKIKTIELVGFYTGRWNTIASRILAENLVVENLDIQFSLKSNRDERKNECCWTSEDEDACCWTSEDEDALYLAFIATELNKAGRKLFLETPRSQCVEVLAKVSDNVQCLMLLLQKRPELCCSNEWKHKLSILDAKLSILKAQEESIKAEKAKLLGEKRKFKAQSGEPMPMPTPSKTAKRQASSR